MDPNKLIEILRGTIDQNQREVAEQQLEQVFNFAGPYSNCIFINLIM